MIGAFEVVFYLCIFFLLVKTNTNDLMPRYFNMVYIKCNHISESWLELVWR